MRLSAIILAATFAAITTFVALAAPIGLATTKVGGSKSAIARCDTNGFTISYGLSGSNVNSVTVAGIADPGCEAATIDARLINSTGVSIGSGTGTVATDAGTVDNSITLTMSPTPTETTVSGIRIVLRGP
jgi:hypothetical protein